jgi:spoIIIJ-associated protein
MQLILDKAVRRLNGHAIRLQVDVEGYLAKKKAGLVHTAQQLARKVKTKGSPATAGYLNAQDRRTVHLALKSDPNVRTQSVGEGPFRKLMIYPKRKPRNKP